MPFHRLHPGLRQRLHRQPFQVVVAPPPASNVSLWIDDAALMQRPTTGVEWDDLFAIASAATVSGANLADPNSSHDAYTIAAALVGVRLNDAAMKQLATDAIASAIGTEVGANWRAIARNLPRYIIAADILKIRSGPIYDWLSSFRTVILADFTDPTLQLTFKQAAWFRGDSLGSRQGFAYTALSVYLQDWQELQWNWYAFRRYIGDRSSLYTLPQDGNPWQQIPTDPVAIQNFGAYASNGALIDGVLAYDMVKSNPTPSNSPTTINAASWLNLSSLALAALIFHRQGYNAFVRIDNALERAYRYLNLQTGDWMPVTESPDAKWILNKVYDLSYPVAYPVSSATTVGFTDWTHPTQLSLTPGTLEDPQEPPPEEFTGTTFYVSPTGGGNGTSTTSRWTVAQANSNLRANQRVMLAPGTYSTNIQPVSSGAPHLPIIYEAEPGGIVLFNDARFDVDANITNIHVKGVKFNSVKRIACDTDYSSSDCIIENCTFENSTVFAGETGWSPHLLLIHGQRHIFRKNTVKRWTHSDTFKTQGCYHLVEDCDFNFADAGHGTIHIQGDHTVMRRCYVRNKWSGVREFVGRPNDRTSTSTPNPAPDNLFEDNIFFDCNLTNDANNEGYPIVGWGAIPSYGVSGDAQTIKPGGTRTIWRNNLMVGCNHPSTHAESTYPYMAQWQIGNYGSTTIVGQQMIHWQYMRWYHNTIYDCGMNCFSLTVTQDFPMYCNDNRWLNNIVHNQEMHDLYLSGGSQYYEDWQYHNNIFTGTVRDRALNGGTPYASFTAWYNARVAQNNARAARMTGNIVTAPTFVSPSYTTPLNDRNIKLDRAKYYLTSGSVGKGGAKALATVTQASTGTTLTLSDSIPFYPDSFGIVGGDIILINGQTRKVMTRNSSTNQITVDSPITVAVGNEVWLNKYGANPDIGILPIVQETAPALAPEPTPTEPPLLLSSAKKSSSDATTFDSLSFTLSANSQIIVIASYLAGSAAPYPPTLTLTGNHGGISAWEKVAERKHDATTDTCIAMWIARTTASPTAGVLTWASDVPFGSAVFAILSWPNLGTNGYLVQATTGSDTTATPSLALVNPLTAGNYILGALHSRSSLGVTPEGGFTELFDQPADSGNAHLQVQYHLTPSSGISSWSGAESLKRNVFLVAEFAKG